MIEGEISHHQKKNKLEGFTYGSFIATSSMSGHIVNIPQLQSAYNAAKAAVRHLCKCLAVECVQFARSNSISPGYIATEISSFVPLKQRIYGGTRSLWDERVRRMSWKAPSYTSPAMLLATLLGVTSSLMAGTVCPNVGGGSETGS